MEFRPFPCQRAPLPPFSLLQNPLNFFLLTVYKTIPRWIESKCVIPVVPVIMITLPTSLWPRNHNVISRDLKPATLRFYEGRSTFIRFFNWNRTNSFSIFFSSFSILYQQSGDYKEIRIESKKVFDTYLFFFFSSKTNFSLSSANLQSCSSKNRKICEKAKSREAFFFFLFRIESQR